MTEPGLAITSSHLALRFYIKEGWTEELLKPCLAKGSLYFRDDSIFGADFSYWTLDHTTHAAFDAEKLLTTAGSIFNYHDRRLDGEEARRYICSLNW